jgi:predicted O-linked N-acetylglucosamine transferase (SPINDLY family)
MGLDALVAQDADQYVDIAVGLSNDLTELSALRSGMRARVAGSSLANPQQVTKELEHAYHTMWKAWCRNEKR